ncbi:MAG: hypothetical protein GQ574_27740 [Crocinitomix sp.]|nr:hypothetical protein [Crocinitomix sp.]
MLGILILIGIIMAFYKGAQSRNLNGILYGILSIVVWFASQFIAAFLKVSIDPYTSEMTIIGWGIGGSLIGIGILYFIMINAGKNKSKDEFSDEIMDDRSIDEL